MTTENVVNNETDHIAVRHVVDRYTDALNWRDWHVLEDLFTENAVWVVTTPDAGVRERREGRREIATGIRALVEHQDGDVVQMNHATVVHVTGDRATARSTMESTYWTAGGTRTLLYAMYNDELERGRDGEWRFVRREWRTKVMFNVVSG
jgi:uncharacterized protein (TIGR02246 family)